MAPENTLAAIEKALEIGADAVEMDVYATRDRQVVLMHDADVRRTTDGRGKIQEMTLAQIRELDAGRWFSEAYEGVRVPTLAEALDLLRTRAIAVIEIKQPGIIPEVLGVIRQTNMEDEVVLISFLEDALIDLREAGALIPAGLLIGTKAAGSARSRAAKRVRDTRRTGACMLDIVHSAADPEFIYEVRRRGISLWVWTVDTPERMQELIHAGIDGITTNYPQRLNAVLENRD